MLIDSSSLRGELENYFKVSKICFCYSAFFTDSAAVWFLKNRLKKENTRVLLRGRPDDFLRGASTISAIKMILEKDIEIKISSALHAKIYVFDNIIYAGSANLTAKGMALCENPNIEFGMNGNPTKRDLAIVENLWDQANRIDNRKLQIMQNYLDGVQTANLKEKPTQMVWPDEIISETRDLYCSDFPIDLNDDDVRWSNREHFLSSLSYNWLLNTVKKKGEVYFGELSQSLHATIFDDPKPYRKEIKDLLANLLNLVEKYDNRNLEIDRPRHSQRVKLKRANFV